MGYGHGIWGGVWYLGWGGTFVEEQDAVPYYL